MNIFGFHQYISERDSYDILFVFDNEWLYVVNIANDDFYNKTYVYTFKNKKSTDFKKQIQLFIDQIKVYYYRVIPENRIDGILKWLPNSIISYLDGKDIYHFDIDFDVKDGITKAEYRDLFTKEMKFYSI